MKKFLVFILIIAALLIIGGGLLFASAVKNNKNKVVTNTYIADDSFTSIDIDISTSDLVFAKTIDSQVKVVCVEREKEVHSVEVKDNTLYVKYVDNRKFYEKFFDLAFADRKVTVYLPEYTYDNLKINASTGNVDMPKDFTFNNLDIKVSTGNVTLRGTVNNNAKMEGSTSNIYVNEFKAYNLQIKTTTGDIKLENVDVTNDIITNLSTGYTNTNNVKAASLDIKASTGKVNLKDTIINNNINIETSTGDVTLEDIDAATLKIKTTTGDVKGTILTDKIIYANTNTGHVDVPHLSSGGICEITTDTGDITISIKN